jgi:acetaldehyde dehydrogenase
MNTKTKVMIIGSGNIGTDLMLKILGTSEKLELVGLIGIDPDSTGLAMAKERGIAITAKGIEGAADLSEFNETKILFDATSAYAHEIHYEFCKQHGKLIVDLTPAAIGPYCVPVVNLDGLGSIDNVNMVTCGGQATIPMVSAVNQVSERLLYAEIVASISSRSAGPGTRANIDEFTETTSLAVEKVGGAEKGRAIIILNPAEPPLIMRNTVYTFSQGASEQDISGSIEQMVQKVNQYVPGYRLKQSVQFEIFDGRNPLNIQGIGKVSGIKSSIFLEVEGSGHYLPSYAGNLDIMTSAAMASAENIAQQRFAA